MTLPVLPSRNDQPAEPPARRTDGALEVHSTFRTLQGEGPYAGRVAVFVRLAGCNLQCPGCDTEYTQTRRLDSIEALMGKVISAGTADGLPMPSLVVLTGGEPFRQNPAELIDCLLMEGLDVQVETNGTLDCRDLSEDVTVVVSPKTPNVHRWTLERGDDWKYVLSHDAVSPDDGLPTTSLGMPYPPCRPPDHRLKAGKVWVQPADHEDALTNQLNLHAAVQSCLKFGYRLSYQLHKLVGVP